MVSIQRDWNPSPSTDRIDFITPNLYLQTSSYLTQQQKCFDFLNPADLKALSKSTSTAMGFSHATSHKSLDTDRPVYFFYEVLWKQALESCGLALLLEPWASH